MKKKYTCTELVKLIVSNEWRIQFKPKKYHIPGQKLKFEENDI